MLKKVIARKIYNSRKEETIAVTAETESGSVEASAPSGKSKGKNEVQDFSDKGIDFSVTLVNALGKKLIDENYKSVNYRYGENAEPHEFTYKPVKQRTAVEILKACACYSYQTCEHPEWKESEAYVIVQVLKARAINKLPGYAEADWEIMT